MRVTMMSPNCDLSPLALTDAADKLPAAKVLRLQVRPEECTYAKDVIRQVARSVEGNAFAPAISLEFCPAFKHNGWALWSGEDCVWSQL